MDMLNAEQRSAVMGRVRTKHTRPEIAVRGLLHRLGFRFRVHRRDLPGSPDIVLPRFRTVVFVHGCFWHRHAKCAKTTTPASNIAFWARKFLANQRRDRRVKSQLRRKGWRVVVVWECETLAPGRLSNRLQRIMRVGESR
ncbi:MAG: very short patch repair endonuclease [Candidatus Binataceae bacterium]